MSIYGVNVFRIGIGYDIHQLSSGRDLLLGGIKIPYDKGCLGHSDGDALIHAIVDALLGALALGDIGTHFPDTEAKYKNIESSILLKDVFENISTRGWKISNIDTNIILEAPKLGKYKEEIKNNLSKILAIDSNSISIKAKTNEGMDASGHGECIIAQAVVLLQKNC